ncbi:MAG: hypothetical protein KAT05_17050 [Spirochaetes bacterium]|nr:hypothetical protein [Spirochaetota bacterium]
MKYGKQGVTPYITVSDDNLDSFTAILYKYGDDGIPFETGTHISEEGVYTLVVQATDWANNISEENVYFEIDLTAPSDTGDITYIIVDNEILFNWQEINEDDLSGYNIYRDNEQLNTDILTETYFADLPGEGTFIYKVTSIDDVLNESNGRQITITIDDSIIITNPQSYDYYNFMFLLTGEIENREIRKIDVDYAQYYDENIIPDDWTIYKHDKNVCRHFVIPVFARDFEDSMYIFRVKAELDDGTTRLACVRIGVDKTKPDTLLYIQELSQYYGADFGEIKDVYISINATVSFFATDTLVNDCASGIKITKYKIVNENDLKGESIFNKLFDWQEWHDTDEPIELAEEGIYYIAFYSIDNAKYFGNIGPINIVKLNIKKIQPEVKSGDLENFKDNFAGISLIKPPKQDYQGNAIINYHIITPPGIQDIQTDLNINYNSSMDETIFGYGCNINLMSISTDGTDDFYNFIYDNKKLPMFETDVTGDYKLVENNMFNTFHKHQDYWELYDKEGKKYIFGSTYSSKIVYPDNSEKWMLDKKIDRNGNFIDYYYAKDTSKIRPISIKYTGNNDFIPYFEIIFEYNASDIIIKIMSGSNYVRKYELNVESDLSGKNLLKEIREYGSNGTDFIEPYVTKLIYSDCDNKLISVENPINGKINIEYNSNNFKMKKVKVYNNNDLLYKDCYEYSNEDGYIIVTNKIDKKNYTNSYYYSTGLKESKLHKVHTYKKKKLHTSIENSWEIINGKLSLSSEKNIEHSKPQKITETIYRYDQYTNIMRIDSTGDTDNYNLSYFLEYANHDINGNAITKLIHSYKMLNNDDIRHYERWYYYDDLDFGEVDTGNLTREVCFNEDDLEEEIKYTYNEYGKIISIVKDENKITTFDYENITNNYIESIIDPSGDIIQTIFDPNTGYILTKEYEEGNIITHSYNDYGRLVNLISSGDENYNIDIEYFLDADNPKIEITKTIDNETFLTELAYDCFGRLLSIKYPDGNTITYKYKDGLLNSVYKNEKGKDKKTYKYIKCIEYDAFKRRIKIKYGDNNYYKYDLSSINSILNGINESIDNITNLVDLTAINKHPMIYDYFINEDDGIIKLIYDNEELVARKEGDDIIWIYK